MTPHRLRALLTCLLVACSLALAACSGDDDDSGTPSPSPASSATTATIAPTGGPSGTQPVAADETINLASAETLSTITGADSGDIHSDLPPLLTADFNGDGLQDVLLGARFGGGPGNSREDAGEVYIIYGRDDWPADVALADGGQDVVVWGPSQRANLGFSAAAADLNGDGADDMILGAAFTTEPGGPDRAGSVHVIFGGPDLPAEIDLATTPADVTLHGPGSSSFFGDDVTAGDVNGDSRLDLIIGATFARRPDNQLSAGITYVIYGQVSWPTDLRMADGDFDVAVIGAEEFDELGDTVASGDFNGDGLDDIAMTAEAADGPDNERPVAAEVAIVFGATDLPRTIDLAKDEADVLIYGADNNDTLGFSLAAGDVTGDDFDDLLMGARGDEGAGNATASAGAIYMLAGAPDLPAVIDLAADPLPGVFGATGGDTLSHSRVASFGGASYVILGAPLARTSAGDTSAGVAYLLSGSSLAGLDGQRSVAQVAVRLLVEAAASGDSLGRSAALADVNGDGAPELLLLASLADAQAEDVGRVYVLPLTLP